jgi:hypothetical protein
VLRGTSGSEWGRGRKRIRLAGHVAYIGARRNSYNALSGKRERRRPLGKRKSRWDDNIKMGLKMNEGM